MNYENDAALGLSCTETTRNAAANKLFGKSFKDLSEEQKQLTLLQMVEDANKTSGAIGQAARESETWTNVMGNLKQSFRDFQAVLGSVVLEKVVGVVNDLANGMQGLIEKTENAIEWCKEHKEVVQAIGIMFLTLGTAIGAYNLYMNTAMIAQKLYTAAMWLSTTAATAFGSVMAFITSPITLVILAIGALVAGVVVMYKRFDWFRDIVDKIKAKLVDFGEKVLKNLKSRISEAGDAFAKVKDKAKELWDNLEPLVVMIRDNLIAQLKKLKEPLGQIWDSFKMVGAVIKDDLLPIVRDNLMPLWDALKPVLLTVAGVIGGALVTAIGTLVGIINGVVNAISGLVQAFSGIVTVVSNVFKLIAGIITGDGQAVKDAVKGIVDGVTTYFGGLWDAVKGFVQGFVDGVVGFFKGLWDTLVGHSIVPDIINGIVNCFAGLWNKVKGLISGFVQNIISGFESLKQKAINTFNSIKEKIASIVGAVKTKVTSVFGDIRQSISTAVSGAQSIVSSKFDAIKKKISDIMSKIKSTVKSGVKTIKDTFDFKWSIPKPKMPKFKVSGGKAPWGFGGEGSLPKISVSWYKKAMQSPMILDEPTIFGYSQKSGQLLGGGEAGSEVVAGTATLMGMIQAAVAEQNETNAYYMQKIVAILADYFPQVVDGLDRPICFDADKGAAAMAVPMNKYLGILKTQKDRGR